jgi:hypothetical protein
MSSFGTSSMRVSGSVGRGRPNMKIESRVERVEREMGLGQNVRPWIVVLRAGPVADEAAYEARLRQRVEQAIRQHPNDAFRLLL